MRSFLFALTFGLAAAQSASTSAAAAAASGTSGCGKQIDAIITSCLGSMNAQLQSCNQQDWDCLCEQSNNVKTCYNNCPTDPRAYAIGQQTESYCNAAKQYGTTSKSKTATATSTASSQASSNSASATSSGSSAATSSSSNGASATESSGASSSSSSDSSKSNSASGVVVAPVGALAAIIGLVALF